MERRDPGDSPPELPQLRRFRMDPDGSGIAHEITPESAQDPSTSSPVDPPTPAPARPVDDVDPNDLLDADLIDPTQTHADDRELVTAGSLAAGSHAPHRPQTSPSYPAVPPAPLYIDPSEKTMTPHKSRVWLIVIALVVKAILAVVIWWAIERSNDEIEQHNSSAAGTTTEVSEEATVETTAPGGVREGGGAIPGVPQVEVWADQVCTALVTYNTENTALRTEIAAVSESGNASSAIVTALEAQAHGAISTLLVEINEIDAPGDPALGVHKDLVAATTSASLSSQSSPAGASPESRLESIETDLNKPMTAFRDSLAELDGATMQSIAAVPACQALGV